MPDTETLAWLGAATALLASLGGLGWVWKIRPRWRALSERVGGALDTITGRPAFVDHTSGKTVPAVPPLGHRLGTVEVAVVQLQDIVAQVADQQQQLRDLQHRVTSLEDGRLEQLVTRAESAQMWRAVADHDLEENQ